MNLVKILRCSSPALITKSIMTRINYQITQITNQMSFTSKFYEALEEKLGKRGEKQFLRLQINAGEGCEGFTYKFKFDDVLNQEKDFIKTQTILSKSGNPQQKVMFAVNCQEVKLLRGATLDFSEEMMREVFYVKENPNAELECSCKVSFSPKSGII